MNNLFPEYNFAVKFPELAKQWYQKKNGELKPQDVTPGSNKKVWWICDKKHVWLATLKRRTINKTGCPFCLNLRVTKENSLQTHYPDMAKEWHPTKNGAVTPEDVVHGSSKKVWWICDKKHSWFAAIVKRTHRKYGCPVCNNRIITEENCLKTKNPALAKEWHPTRNGLLTAENISVGSDKKVWWKCKKGHEWQARLNSRVHSVGCPFCSGQRASRENCLAVKAPWLVHYWHPKKNGVLTPYNVTPYSPKKVWWKCKKGHSWIRSIDSMNNRQKSTDRCPVCCNKTTTSENSLATKYPEVAKEWHPTRNSPFTPENTIPGSRKKVWWKCKKGHEWQADVDNQVQVKSRCPYCGLRKLAPDHSNSLAKTNKPLAMEWNYDKNGLLTPMDVLANKHIRVWWICRHGHEWKSYVGKRNRTCSSCPKCAVKNSNNFGLRSVTIRTK